MDSGWVNVIITIISSFANAVILAYATKLSRDMVIVSNKGLALQTNFYQYEHGRKLYESYKEHMFKKTKRVKGSFRGLSYNNGDITSQEHYLEIIAKHDGKVYRLTKDNHEVFSDNERDFILFDNNEIFEFQNIRLLKKISKVTDNLHTDVEELNSCVYHLFEICDETKEQPEWQKFWNESNKQRILLCNNYKENHPELVAEVIKRDNATYLF